MVHMNRTPHGSIFINNLVVVGNPPDTERALPPWSQLVRALKRGCHRVDQAPFLIWVDNNVRRWSSHVLMRQFQSLGQDFNRVGEIINRRRGMCIMLNIRWEGRLSACRHHRCRKPVWFMRHSIKGEHNARRLSQPMP